MPVHFSVVTDLTGPSFELTEALLAAFSQLPEVELHLGPARAAQELWNALPWEASCLSARGAVSEPRCWVFMWAACLSGLVTRVQVTTQGKEGGTSSTHLPQNHCLLSLRPNAFHEIRVALKDVFQ